MSNPPEILQPTLRDAANMGAQRIEIARDTLHSSQQISQFLDQKSYLVLVIMGVTSAAFFSTVGSFLGKLAVLLSPRAVDFVSGVNV